ncbi:ProQ/FINO family protein [Rhizobium sp. Root1220]|uniref:ProQ/FINO family protein n=1 Tax=Rhizobium sp. Root1220 TaxID=1736432 RepID=UPI0006F29B03|nr:ProQ/FINO family protein [Rhizobium sp. Root1220]KQV65352.1 ProQ/FINO family protein [Rhizobium sp. Root1220]
MTKPWTTNRGPVTANEADLAKAQAINAMLQRAIEILPAKVGDPIKPFALGLWNEIRPLLNPDTGVTALRRATGAYLHSKRYHFAIAQPGAMRYDLQGNPAEPVSEVDRLAAQERYQSLKRTSASPAESVSHSAPVLSRTEQIRAALLTRRKGSDASPQ